MDAFVPYLRVDDSRQKELAKRIDDIVHMRASDSINHYDTFTVLHYYIFITKVLKYNSLLLRSIVLF